MHFCRRIIWQILRKLYIHLKYDSSNFTTKFSSQENENVCPYKDLSLTVHSSFCPNSKNGKQPDIHQQVMDKEVMTCVCNGILLSSEKGTNYWYRQQLG